MVSRRTFAVITMLMAIILFLFQGLNLAKEKLNHYEKNAYAAEKEDLEDGSGAFGTEDASGEKNITGSRGRSSISEKPRSILWGRLSVNGAGI